MNRFTLGLTAAVCLAAPCLAAPCFADPIAPGAEAPEAIQEALILAKPGQVVELGEGTFELPLALSLSVDGVTLRGQGPKKTILDFTAQEAGSEGLLVTSSRVTLEGFAVVGTKGDAIKVKGAKGITFRSVRAAWRGEPKATNGGYGLYPVQCEDVLIEDCSARGASDAGIYVGQSKNVIIRRCRVEENVAGIEVENSRVVDVYDNVATKNTGGILVFDLPNLPVKGGGHVRVFRNTITDNETPNFAPKGNIVASVPRGTGMLIMANRGVEIFENEIGGHTTTNLLIVSYLVTGLPLKDVHYDPFPDAIHVHANRFGPCGSKPDGVLGGLAVKAVSLPLPSVVWDGIEHPERPTRIRLHDNGADVGFANLDLGRLMSAPETANPSRDRGPVEGTLPRLTPVELSGTK